MKKVDRVEYDMSIDARDIYTKDEIEAWCKESFLPINYFDLSVQEKRDAIKKAQRQMHLNSLDNIS